MSVQLGSFWQSPAPPPPPAPQDDLLERVLLAISALQSAVLTLPTPVVQVEPADLTAIVTAVQGLHGPASPSAEDIAAAVKQALGVQTPAAPDLASEKIVEVLDRLDFRMKGSFIAGGGPNSVTVNNASNQPVPVVSAGAAVRLADLCIASTVIAPAAVVLTPFLDVSQYPGLRYTVNSDQLVDGQVDWSNDGSTVHHSVGSTFSGAGSFHGPIEAQYARISITNLAASSATFRLETYGLRSSPSPLLFPVGAVIDPSFPAELVKAVTTATQPDGDYVNSKADGTVFTNTTALGAAGVFTSAWFDSDGWRALDLAVKTDQVSASGGIVIEFTDNVQAATPVARTSHTHTFTAADVVTGFLVIRLPTELDGFRVRYTNGGTAQGSFFIEADVRVTAGELTRTALEQDVTANDQGVLTRSLLLAKNPLSGTFNNVTRGASDGSSRSGLHTSVMEHIVATPLKRLDSISGNATSVDGTAILVATSAPSNTQSVMLQADSANTKEIYLGTTSSLTSGNAMHVLPAGASVTYPVGESQAFYALAASGTQTLRWTFGVRSV